MTNIPDVQETLNQPEPAPSADTTNTLPVETPAVAETHAPEAREESAPQNDAKERAAAPSVADDKDAKKKATLLDVVKNGLEKGKPDSDSSNEGEKRDTAEGESNEAKTSQDDGQQPKEDAQKAADKVPFHNHPRWKEMVSEREALKPKAEQYEKITTFMKQNALSETEMVEGFNIMAMMKQDPAKAYAALRGYVDQLAPLAGEVLPEDLKKRVDDGFDSEESAKELARLRAEREFAAARQREAFERQEQERAAQSQREMVSAVTSWEQAEEAKDPDWSKKYNLVNDRVRVLLTTERPATPTDAIKLAQRALSDVNASLSSVTGRNTPIKAPTSSMSSASTRPNPRSLLDVVKYGLNT
jgi:hypothetical protein